MADISKMMTKLAADLRSGGYSEEAVQAAMDEFTDALPHKITQAARQAVNRAHDAHMTQGKTEKYRSLDKKRSQLAGTLEGLRAPPRAGHVQKNKSYRERKKILAEIDEVQREMTSINEELNPSPKGPGVIMPPSYYRALNRDD